MPDSVPMIQEAAKRQELTQLDNEIEFNEAIIAEREQSIVEIEQAIHEVNEIFRELGSMVHEQQGMIGIDDSHAYEFQIILKPTLKLPLFEQVWTDIDEWFAGSITSSSLTRNLGDATLELQSASKYQKMARNRMCWILLIFAVIGVVLIMVVVLLKK